MSSDFLTSSIAKRGTYLGGASPNVSIKRWDLDLWSEVTVGDPSDRSDRRLVLGFSREYEGVRFVHELRRHADDPLEDRTLSWPIQARFVCHVLLDKIPDRGLPELCESLATIFDFYGTRQAASPMLPTHRMQAAQSRASYTRPEFYFEEE